MCSIDKSGSKYEQVLKVLAFLPLPVYVMSSVLIMKLSVSSLENAVLGVLAT